MKLLSAALGLAIACAWGTSHAEAKEAPAQVSKIAFGSCNDAKKPQTIWPVIAKKNPDVWIWMGDTIYPDFKDFNQLKHFQPPFTLFTDAKPSKIQKLYEQQLSSPEYKNFVEQVPVIGIWDDHDYGRNDGGKWFPHKQKSQELFLNFIGEPADSPRREQKGIYTAVNYGSGDRSVKVILLDTRYHRDYYRNNDGDFLGKKQWKWLEDELRSSKASINIIVSGIQVLPEDKLAGESWSKFEKKRQKLLDLVTESGAAGVIFLSGDVHYGEVNQLKCGKQLLTEITSSGLTHSWGTKWYAPFFYFADYILPWPYRQSWGAHTAKMNFGELDIHWETADEDAIPEVTARLYGVDGETVVSYRFRPPQYDAGTRVQCEAVQGAPNLLVSFARMILFSAVCTIPFAGFIIVVVWLMLSFVFFIRDTLSGKPPSAAAAKTKEAEDAKKKQ